jgi:hypothetical protein
MLSNMISSVATPRSTPFLKNLMKEPGAAARTGLNAPTVGPHHFMPRCKTTLRASSQVTPITQNAKRETKITATERRKGAARARRVDTRNSPAARRLRPRAVGMSR